MAEQLDTHGMLLTGSAREVPLVLFENNETCFPKIFRWGPSLSPMVFMAKLTSNLSLGKPALILTVSFGYSQMMVLQFGPN